MPLQKQSIPINFSQGVDTKNDPFQLNLGSFLALQNSVFTKGKRLTKRNGYSSLADLPFAASYLTTFNGDLTAIGSNLQAYLAGNNEWINKGNIQPLSLDTKSLIRNNTSQTQADTAIASNGFICTVYTDQNPSNLNNVVFKYAVADSITGQNIIPPTVIANADTTPGNAQGYPRVFLLGSYFIIIYVHLISGPSNYSLQYIAISVDNPASVTAPADITTSIGTSSTIKPTFDAVSFSNKLFIAWGGAAASGTKIAFITSTMPGTATPITTVTLDAVVTGSFFSVTADVTTSAIWVSYGGPAAAWTIAVNPTLGIIRPKVQIFNTGTLINLTSVANNGVLTAIFELQNVYSYDGAIKTNILRKNTVIQSTGVLDTETTVLRSVGLASKGFLVQGVPYVLAIYVSTYQTTYFLTDLSGHIVAKLAYGNADTGSTFGFVATGLPNVNVTDNVAQVSYLFKDSIQSVNKNTNVPSGSQVAGIYSQLGINLAKFSIGSANIVTAEIGTNLNISGGFLWAYDGYVPVEQGFFLYPDFVELTAAGSGSGLTAQAYFYQVTYEWTDNQGNAFRSSPSIPVSITPTAGQNVTINVPTLRLTYKTANPVKIVVYRWSTAQETYYQVTSITTPTLNNPTVDSVAIVDSLSDAAILGNNILYTTGGTVENIGPPATDIVTLFDDRLWLVDAEDKNLLWFSKQVIESTPVEMSDLFTIFIAPTTAAQGSTGPITALAAMDDKLIIFKKDAIYYINGVGPDNTGANNQYSPPILITSTVGCANQNSILFMPEGLMFQSDKGIWLLGRNLSTQYIGAPVEQFNSSLVLSGVNIPGTNQVRFTLDSGVTLMYDYFYGQWGTFVNVPGISSTLFQGLHTFINSFGKVYQETPGKYLDGSSPVLMSFTTSWINLAGLQGYQRAYYVYLLGTYLSPHLLTVQIAYDYNASATQQSIIQPTNFAPVYGQDLNYGSGSPYGGPGNIERWRIFLATQRCESFQVSVNEVYDPSFGVVAGPGLTLSGMNIVAGMKRGFSPMRADQSVG